MIYVAELGDYRLPVSMVDNKVLLCSTELRGQKFFMRTFEKRSLAKSIEHNHNLMMYKPNIPRGYEPIPSDVKNLLKGFKNQEFVFTDYIDCKKRHVINGEVCVTPDPSNRKLFLNPTTHRPDTSAPGSSSIMRGHMFPDKHLFTFLGDFFQSSMLSAHVEDHKDNEDALTLMNRLVRTAASIEYVKPYKIENYRWQAIVCVKDDSGEQIVITSDVNVRDDLPVSAKIHHFGSQPYIHGLRVASRQGIATAGCVLEACCLNAYEYISELVPVSGKKIIHMGFVCLNNTRVLILNESDYMTDLEAILYNSLSRNIRYAPEKCVWDKDYGRAAFYFLGRRPYNLIRNDILFKMKMFKTSEQEHFELLQTSFMFDKDAQEDA